MEKKIPWLGKKNLVLSVLMAKDSENNIWDFIVKKCIFIFTHIILYPKILFP